LNKYCLVIIFLLASPLFVSCAHSNGSVDYALGEVNQKELLIKYDNFSKSYQGFTIEAEQEKQVEQWPSNLKIDVYFATWCHDSEREVPRLLKALQKNNQIKVMLLALDYQKSEPNGRAKEANIKYTPTFIISLAEKEIGRIIERPKESLVGDISDMLKKSKV
jgi:thioredoxin 1